MDNITLFFSISGLSHHSQILDNLMIFITQYLIYLTFLFMLILSLKGGFQERKTLILVILALPVAILLIKVIHIFYLEPRPFVTFHLVPLTDNKPDWSFPSRHTTIMAVMAFSYAYFKSKWSVFFLSLMILVGLSRVYVGVHYPLDIFGGFVVGAISLIITLAFVRLLRIKFLR